MLKNEEFFCSWSGGKDSCLSLYRCIKEGGIPRLLLTMFTEGGERSRSHGLEKSIVQAQADSLGIPVKICSASWADYENVFLKALSNIKRMSLNMGIFGDIDLQDHKDWVERVCSKASIKSYLPLWKENREDILSEFIELGFKARIVALKDGTLDKNMLGKYLDASLAKELKLAGVDPCGENGEFHTVVTDGPIFSYPLEIIMNDSVLRDGYWFADFQLK